MERIWLKSYPEGVPAEIDLSALGSLGDFIKTSFEKFRDRTAFISIGKAMSYGELDRKSRAFASHLETVARLPRGARVALMMPNVLQYPIAAFGALRAGYVIVNGNPLYSPRELKHQLADFGRRGDRRFGELCRDARKGDRWRVGAQDRYRDRRRRPVGSAKGLIVNSVVRHVRRAVPAFSLPQAESFNRALALGSRQSFTDAPISPNDIAFLQYTGGTTGVPKGAMLTHRNMVANLRQILHAWIAPAIGAEGEIFVAALPLYHVFALQVNGFVPLLVGASVSMIANPRDIPALVKALRRTRFTAIPGVKHAVQCAAANKDFAGLDSQSCAQIGGGMAVQRAVVDRWQNYRQATDRRLSIDRELPASIANPLSTDHFYGSIGLPVASTDSQLSTRRGATSSSGKPANCDQGPPGHGWLLAPARRNRPGDDLRRLSCGRASSPAVDKRGYVYVVDRKKDMILVSGFNVFPNEIEDVVNAPGGARGGRGWHRRRNYRRGGQGRRCPQGHVPDRGRSRAVLRQHLTGYKRPRFVEFREPCPTPPSARSSAASCGARTERWRNDVTRHLPFSPGRRWRG